MGWILPKAPSPTVCVVWRRNHWQGLTLFVEDPDLPMDNNQAERALRGPVVGRKNYYGSGAQWSGEWFLPWNRRAARVPRASPAQVVDSRAA